MEMEMAIEKWTIAFIIVLIYYVSNSDTQKRNALTLALEDDEPICFLLFLLCYLFV